MYTTATIARLGAADPGCAQRSGLAFCCGKLIQFQGAGDAPWFAVCTGDEPEHHRHRARAQ